MHTSITRLLEGSAVERMRRPTLDNGREGSMMVVTSRETAIYDVMGEWEVPCRAPKS